MRPVLRTSPLLILLLATSLMAKQKQDTALPSNPNDLVRKAIQNQLNDPEMGAGELHAWRERSVKPNRTTLKQFVETPQGLVARLLTVNDKPLSGDDRAKEDARINRLLDPRQMDQKRKEQKADETRSRRMVGALPDAFIYTYAGNTEDKDGHTLVNLTFKPNPNFNPPTREALVYQGMEGTMVIDATATRLVKIDGTMMKDVTIGWGIIGHLDKGGRFIVEQAEVDKGDWQVTKMRLNFTGKALLFKNIRIDETDTSTDFHKIPKMTVAEAIDYLKKSEQENAVAARENLK